MYNFVDRYRRFGRVYGLKLVNPLTPNDPYSGRTAPLNSKRCILYIHSINTGTEYFKHGIYSPFFFYSKCSLFHNSNIFGSCFIHILYTECAKIKKKKFRRQKFNLLAVISNPEMVASDSSKKKRCLKFARFPLKRLQCRKQYILDISQCNSSGTGCVLALRYCCNLFVIINTTGALFISLLHGEV